MRQENYNKLFIILGIVFIMLYFIVMYFEIVNFSPYNKGVPFFIDRIFEFLLPGVLCFVIAHNRKKNLHKNRYDK